MDKSDLKEIFEDFLRSNQSVNEYSISLFKIREDVCDQVLVTARVGGSSGASCWDSHPSVPYRNDREDIESDLASEIRSSFRDVTEKLGIAENILELVATNMSKDLYYNELGDKSDGDYYGNYSQENVYAVSVRDFFDKVLSSANMEVFDEVLMHFKAVASGEYNKKVLKEREAALQKQLDIFDTDHAKEKKSLESQIAQLKRNLN
jgi:hypothetical protein